MFLAISTNHGDPTPFLAAEGDRTQALIQQGVLGTLLLKADWSGAVMVLHAADAAAARASLDTLPLVKAGVAEFELTEVVAPPPTPVATAGGA